MRKITMGKQSTTEEFILKAKAKHGDKYEYSKVEYTKSRNKVIIICPDHGEWFQRPNDHLMGCGCPACKFEKIAALKRSSKNEFIIKAKEVHGETYIYDHVKYSNAITKVKIMCSEHGFFKQTPDKHLSGTMCPKCSNGVSRGERKIQQFFDNHKILYEREKRFSGLCGSTKNSRLRYDFYLPNHNFLIEYDGEQHFDAIRIKGRLSHEEATQAHKATIVNDKKKTKYAEDHGYNLLRISYTEFNNIDNILAKLF